MSEERGEYKVDTKELETVDEAVETLPDAGGLVSNLPAERLEDQIALAENIGKIVEAQNKIRAALMGLAQPGDWVVFKSGEGDGKAEIGFAGAMRISSTLGVSFRDFEARKESGVDEMGAWYRWEVECTAIFRGREVRVYGRAGSRDKFFGKRGGEYRPLHEINEGDLKMVARRASMKEGVKVLFGLHHMDPVDMERRGVRLERASGFTFKDKEQKMSEVEVVTVGIADITMKKTDKWTKYTVADTEGVRYSTFSETVAKAAKECREFNTKATISFKTTQYGPEIVSLAPAQVAA